MAFFKDSTQLEFKQFPFLKPPQKLDPEVTVNKTIVTPIKYVDRQPQPIFIDLKPIIISAKDVETPRLEAFEFSGKKLGFSKILNASDLLFRDNSKYNIKYLDNEHGSFSNMIKGFEQDQKGNTWIASQDAGMALYNGYTFKILDDNSGLPSKRIEQLYLDSQNRLWVTTLNGLSYIKNDSIFSLKNNQNVQFNKIFEDLDHAIWFSTFNKGAYKFQNDSVEIYNSTSGLSGNGVSAIFQDSNKIYWFGMLDNKEFTKYDGNNFYHFYSKKNELGVNINDFIEYEHAIWFGSFEGGIVKFINNKYYRYNFSKHQKGNVYAFVKNKNGLWFSIYGSGIANFKDNKFKFITKNEGLPDNSIFKLFIDKQDNIWISSFFSGFSRLEENVFYKETFDDVLPITNVESILTDPSQTEWFLPHGGQMVSKKGLNFQAYTNDSNYKTHHVNYSSDGFFEAPGKAWLATFGLGIVYFTEKNYTFYNFKKGNDILKIDRDLKKRMWFASDKSGAIIKEKDGFYNIDKANGLNNSHVTTLLSDSKGSTWLSVQNSGIAIITNDSITNITKKEGLISNDISSFFEDNKQRIWLGSAFEGVQLIAGKITYTFNKKKGLLSNNITAITQDFDSAIWITSSNGLTRLKINSNQKVDIKNFDKHYGLNLIGLTKASKAYKSGKVIFGSKNGVLIYNKSFERDRVEKPKLILNNISIDNVELLNMTPTEPIKFSQNQKLTIDFYALNWGNENTLKYEYRILQTKNQREWISNDNYTRVSLQNFELFDTEIQIRAISMNGESNIIKIPIEIQPYFYQNIYYHIIFWIFLIGLLVFYYQYKKRLAIKKKKELEREIVQKTKEITSEKEEIEKSHKQIVAQNKEKDILIQEVHHRVKNNLQLISSLVSMQLNSLKSEKSKRILEETYNRINSMALVHEILYNKENVSFISLKTYLSDLVNSISEMMNQEKRQIIIHKSFADINIDVSYCIALGMITNEVISNSMKYAFKDHDHPEIRIKLYCDSKSNLIIYTIKDNGIGINPKFLSTKNKSLGLRLITIFSKQLNAELEIKNDNGTEILVKFKCTHHESCGLKQRELMGCDKK